MTKTFEGDYKMKSNFYTELNQFNQKIDSADSLSGDTEYNENDCIDNNFKIEYQWVDFQNFYKNDMDGLFNYIQNLANNYLNYTDFDFYDFSATSDQSPTTGKNKFWQHKNQQKGVVRVNCIDCLDRTNNAMACIASVALARMIESFRFDTSSIINPTTKGLKGELLSVILDIFAFNGDRIAMQYAGSEAFHKAQIYKTVGGEWKSSKHNCSLIAVKRYISNALMDYDRQRTWWLYLGDFMPSSHEKKPLWD